MNRSVVLVLSLLVSLTGSSWAQEEGSVVAALRCVNCDDPELLAGLQPIDPEATSHVCSLQVALEVAPDGRVVDAYALVEAPPLCERRAIAWARATRWSVDGGAPVTANLPLEFEIQRTIRPRCLNACDPERIFDEIRRNPQRFQAWREEAGRPAPGEKGFRCETTMGLRIDDEGRVIDTKILDGDRNPDCLTVFRRWAEGTRWSPAYDRGEPVVVWIAQPFSIRTD